MANQKSPCVDEREETYDDEEDEEETSNVQPSFNTLREKVNALIALMIMISNSILSIAILPNKEDLLKVILLFYAICQIFSIIFNVL